MADDIDRDDDYDDRSPAARPESKRVTAGILAILLGTLGVHKFYLGYTTAGILQILACGGLFGVVGLVEGIIYLTKSDKEFVRTYQVGKKAWF